jgi:hypothetical protein
MNIWELESLPQRHEIYSPTRHGKSPKGKIRTVAIKWYALSAMTVIRPDATRDSWSLLVNRCRKRYESHRTSLKWVIVVKKLRLPSVVYTL